MPSIAPSKSITKTRIAKVPYLNSAPFFRGWAPGDSYELTDCVPRVLGARAAAGEVAAGLLPIVDFFRLEQTFERLGRFGIAVRGRAHSATLFSRKPIRQLDGAVISVTEQSSTTARLLRLLLEAHFHVQSASYEPPRRQDADALLLIGDEALQFGHTNTQFPYEVDVAFEWWLWQHLPFVFTVWAIRRDAEPQLKKRLEQGLAHSLAVNTGNLEPIVQEASTTLGLPETALREYLANFIYRLSQPEEEAIAKFRSLLDEHHLL